MHVKTVEHWECSWCGRTGEVVTLEKLPSGMMFRRAGRCDGGMPEGWQRSPGSMMMPHAVCGADCRSEEEEAQRAAVAEALAATEARGEKLLEGEHIPGVFEAFERRRAVARRRRETGRYL